MARNPRYDILFEPIQVGPKVLKNRFYQTPHCTGFGGDRPGTQAHFRAMKAEGGWAVVNTEWCCIHPEGDAAPSPTVRLWDDHDVRNISLMCEKVHEHGALAGVELGFGGSVATNYETRSASRGVSQVTDDVNYWHCCFEMDKEEIRELQGFYALAAVRACRAGFDLINICGSEGFGIPQEFLMSCSNKRSDEYGGSFENRSRFWLETLECVREAVGGECAIVTRLCVDTLHDGAQGIRVADEGVGFIELADHLVDLWDLQVGGRTKAEWGDDAGASRFFRENFQAPWVSQVRRHTSKPIVGVGRFTNPDTMVRVLESRQLDIIGAARPSIADPFLPKKIEEGRVDEIRECIGCNICVSRHEQFVPIACTQNATAGEEYRRGWHPERFEPAQNADNDVLVVGAGPAGMECAMILGKRGMRRVHLVEAQDQMGGIMRWIPQLPGLGEWARVVNYRKIQIDKLKNVELIPSTALDAKGVSEYGAEIVVVATGSCWATNGLSGQMRGGIPGADATLPWQLTPDQIMVEGKHVPGERALVLDCDGYFMGASIAEKLAREGTRVTFVTPFEVAAPYMFHTLEGIRMNRLLRELGIDVQPGHVVTTVEPGVVTGCHVFAEHVPVMWETDAIVLVTQRVSRTDLYTALRHGIGIDFLRAGGVAALYRIGDCVAPRLVAECVFDGHRLAREIDSDDPSTPRSYIRERRVLGASDHEYDGVLQLDGKQYRPSSVLSAAR